MEKSRILRGMTRDGSARIHVIDSRAMVEELRRIHNASPTAAAAGGRLLSAAAIMGSMCGERQDTVSLTVAATVRRKLIAVGVISAMQKGILKIPRRSRLFAPWTETDVGAAVGCGALRSSAHAGKTSRMSVRRRWSAERSPRTSPPILLKANRFRPCLRSACWPAGRGISVRPAALWCSFCRLHPKQ